MFISAILSFFIVKFQQSNVLKSYTTFAIRIFQLVIIILFLYIGCYIFAQHHYYCNFAPSLTMIALGVLAVAVEPVVYLILRYLIKVIVILYLNSKKLVAFLKKK